MRYLSVIVCIGMIFVLDSCTKDKTPEPQNNNDTTNIDTITYIDDVKPIIDVTCTFSGCHNSGSFQGDFTNYDGLKQKVIDGTFKTRVIELQDMPPSGSPGPDSLRQGQIDTLQLWLDFGAPKN